MNDETSSAFQGLEIRAEPGRAPRLVGYAAVFNSRSVELPGGFVEIVRPGAFKRALATADVRALIDHDPRLILGRTTAGTLTLAEDDRGLKVEIEPPDTPAGRGVLVSVQRGDLDGMSFGFRTRTDRWQLESKPPLRELLDVDLFDVSVVAFPAYPRTEIALRSLAEAQREAAMLLERAARERRLAALRATVPRKP